MKKTEDILKEEEKKRVLQIKKVLDTNAGAELKRYFLQQIILLRNIANIQEYSTTTATALEVKVQKRVCGMFEKMLNQIMNWSEQEIQEIEKENDWGIE